MLYDRSTLEHVHNYICVKHLTWQKLILTCVYVFIILSLFYFDSLCYVFAISNVTD